MNTQPGSKSQDSCFEDQVRQLQALAFSVAFGILLNAEESLDIQQEAFVKAFQNPNFLAEGFDRKNWLITVARNLAINLKKSWWRRVRVLAGLREMPEGSHSPEFAEFFIRQESLARLKTAMQSLSDEEREIISLRYGGRQSYAQMAELLHIQIGTVMSRLARVKTKLGDLLREKDEDE